MHVIKNTSTDLIKIKKRIPRKLKKRSKMEEEWEIEDLNESEEEYLRRVHKIIRN